MFISKVKIFWLLMLCLTLIGCGKSETVENVDEFSVEFIQNNKTEEERLNSIEVEVKNLRDYTWEEIGELSKQVQNGEISRDELEAKICIGEVKDGCILVDFGTQEDNYGGFVFITTSQNMANMCTTCNGEHCKKKNHDENLGTSLGGYAQTDNFKFLKSEIKNKKELDKDLFKEIDIKYNDDPTVMVANDVSVLEKQNVFIPSAYELGYRTSITKYNKADGIEFDIVKDYNYNDACEIRMSIFERLGNVTEPMWLRTVSLKAENQFYAAHPQDGDVVAYNASEEHLVLIGFVL